MRAVAVRGRASSKRMNEEGWRQLVKAGWPRGSVGGRIFCSEAGRRHRSERFELPAIYALIIVGEGELGEVHGVDAARYRAIRREFSAGPSLVGKNASIRALNASQTAEERCAPGVGPWAEVCGAG